MRVLATVSLLLLTACFPVSAPFHIYPISETGSGSAIPCRFRIHFGWQSATITASLPNGETFESVISTASSVPPDRELAPLWDKVFGAGYFNAKVLGSAQHFRTALRSQQGHELRMELHRMPGDRNNGFEGVAIDNNNLIYKAGY